MEHVHPLRRWRKERGLNLTEVANALVPKVTPSHLSEIERGRNMPSMDLAVRLSKATGGEVKIEDFARAAE